MVCYPAGGCAVTEDIGETPPDVEPAVSMLAARVSSGPPLTFSRTRPRLASGGRVGSEHNDMIRAWLKAKGAETEDVGTGVFSDPEEALEMGPRRGSLLAEEDSLCCREIRRSVGGGGATAPSSGAELMMQMHAGLPMEWTRPTNSN